MYELRVSTHKWFYCHIPHDWLWETCRGTTRPCLSLSSEHRHYFWEDRQMLRMDIVISLMNGTTEDLSVISSFNPVTVLISSTEIHHKEMIICASRSAIRTRAEGNSCMTCWLCERKVDLRMKCIVYLPTYLSLCLWGCSQSLHPFLSLSPERHETHNVWNKQVRTCGVICSNQSYPNAKTKNNQRQQDSLTWLCQPPHFFH